MHNQSWKLYKLSTNLQYVSRFIKLFIPDSYTLTINIY